MCLHGPIFGTDLKRILEIESSERINTYSMKQPDLYYFETIKKTSQAWSND